MGTYRARVYSSDRRFHGMKLLFDSSIPVSDNTKLIWLEPLKEGADKKETAWHKKLSKMVVKNA